MIFPLGIAHGPAGALVLPALADDAAAARVMRGETDGLPPEWAFYAHAVHDDLDAALGALGGDELATYNRFVLTGHPELYAALAGTLAGDLRLLLEAAAYQHGVVDELPDAVAAEPLVGAYLALAREDVERGRRIAEHVAERSPILAARLLEAWAAVTTDDRERTGDVLAALEHARALLARTALCDEAGGLALQYGLLAHERSDGHRDRLLAAVHAYQRALQTFTKDGPHAEDYALAHMNLGLAYLALPMNDEAERLRPAIAIQSLREAVSALDAMRSPDLWAGATLNLANALQHVRSTHVEENLWEAVALYEDILPLPAGDTLRKARVLANQGNALAHLGAFSRAVPRLNEARAIFALSGDDDSTAAIDATLAEIGTRAPSGEPHGTA
jgi:tetratricopeptide (TPR) repeat protein